MKAKNLRIIFVLLLLTATFTVSSPSQAEPAPLFPEEKGSTGNETSNQTGNGTIVGGARSQPTATSGDFEVDVWLESWYRFDTEIYRIDRPRSYMHSNFQVNIYANKQFTYAVLLDYAERTTGSATWKAQWYTNFYKPELAITVVVTPIGGGEARNFTFDRMAVTLAPDSAPGGIPEGTPAGDGSVGPGESLIGEAVAKTRTDSDVETARLFTLGGAAVGIMIAFWTGEGVWLEALARVKWTNTRIGGRAS